MPEQVARAVLDRADGRCEFMNFPFCTGHGQVIHHRKISGREHTVVNCVHICQPCHEWVHRNPAESYRLGWLVKMGYAPESVPVQYRGRPALLGSDGSVSYQEIDA